MAQTGVCFLCGGTGVAKHGPRKGQCCEPCGTLRLNSAGARRARIAGRCRPGLRAFTSIERTVS